MDGGEKMLKPINRLKKRKEFAYLYNNGKAVHTSHLTLVYLPTKYRPLKVGFSVAKKIGKAYMRNLIKRRLRAIMRDIVPTLPSDYNVVIIAKSGIETISYGALRVELGQLVNKSGLKKC